MLRKSFVSFAISASVCLISFGICMLVIPNDTKKGEE